MDLEEQYERVLKYCYMKVNNRELAEDITQETFLKFWETKSYRSMGKEMAYLYTIARNLCIDYFKKKKEDLSGEESFWENVPDNRAKTEEASVRQVCVEQALGRLNGEDREMAVLRFIGELSVADVGAIMGMSRFAVHRRLKSVKEILKKELEELR